MIGREANITSNLLMNYYVAISYVNSSVPLSTTLLERECICETINPGPILIIRNNFPTTIIHFLFAAIYKFENPKILLLLVFKIQNTKTLSIIAIIIFVYHPCIFISCLHLYFLFAFIIIFILFLHLVLDNHLVRLRTNTSNLCFVGNQKKDRKTILTLLIP